jgi:ATP-dependent DNA helicase RecQ
VDETALKRLRSLTGEDDAGFRVGQLEAIRDVVVDRTRVLCVQRTGATPVTGAPTAPHSRMGVL